MRLAPLTAAVLLTASHAAWAASSEPGDPTPRKGISPLDAAKIKQFEAKRWLGFGARAGAAGANSDVVQTTVSGAIPGRRSCTTQIGPNTPGNVGPAGQPTSTPRFGQTRDNTVIVTGSVINVCR